MLFIFFIQILWKVILLIAEASEFESFSLAFLQQRSPQICAFMDGRGRRRTLTPEPGRKFARGRKDRGKRAHFKRS